MIIHEEQDHSQWRAQICTFQPSLEPRKLPARTWPCTSYSVCWFLDPFLPPDPSFPKLPHFAKGPLLTVAAAWSYLRDVGFRGNHTEVRRDFAGWSWGSHSPQQSWKEGLCRCRSRPCSPDTGIEACSLPAPAIKVLGGAFPLKPFSMVPEGPWGGWGKNTEDTDIISTWRIRSCLSFCLRFSGLWGQMFRRKGAGVIDLIPNWIHAHEARIVIRTNILLGPQCKL